MSTKQDAVSYPRFVMRRRVLKLLSHAALHALTRFRIQGSEHIPATGPYIVVANHFHWADPAAIIRIIPRQVEFIGDTTVPNSPKVVGWIRHLWGYILIHRGGHSHAGLRAATRVLRQGGVLFVAPEAGSWAEVLRPARPGTAFLAVQSGVPLLPVGLDGLPDMFRALRRGERAIVTARVGPVMGPFQATGRGKRRRRQLDAIGHEIMRGIARLLPPNKHGYYSVDPAFRAAAEEAARYPWAPEHVGNTSDER